MRQPADPNSEPEQRLATLHVDAQVMLPALTASGPVPGSPLPLNWDNTAYAVDNLIVSSSLVFIKQEDGRVGGSQLKL
jgi:hypothetical protein